MELDYAYKALVHLSNSCQPSPWEWNYSHVKTRRRLVNHDNNLGENRRAKCMQTRVYILVGTFIFHVLFRWLDQVCAWGRKWSYHYSRYPTIHIISDNIGTCDPRAHFDIFIWVGISKVFTDCHHSFPGKLNLPAVYFSPFGLHDDETWKVASSQLARS